MKFLCDQCKAKYQIADDKVVGKTVRMKCRKCGHMIEVKAEVTESSVATKLPGEPTVASPAPAKAAAPGAKLPQPPRATPQAPRAPAAPVAKPAAPKGALATSLASARPPAQSRAEGPLASAFQKSVQQKDDDAAMLDLHTASEWYVAINGVPVGPIRVGELKRKAASGGITEDSLCWQEGMEEWRPVRSVTELAALLREVAAAGRPSLVTPPVADVRPSMSPPGVAPKHAQTPRAPQHSRTDSGRPLSPAARSNVVAINSRLATAEQLNREEEDHTVVGDPFAIPPPAPRPVADPFASPIVATAPSAALAPSPDVSIAATSDVAAAIAQPQKAPPWIAIGMLVLFGAFGVTAAIMIFQRPPVPVAGPVATVAPVASVPSTPPTTTVAIANTAPSASVAPTSPDKPAAVAMNGGGGVRPASTGTGKVVDPSIAALLGNNTGPVGPGTGPASGGGGGSQAALSSDAIESVVRMHSTSVKRQCWERGGSTMADVNVKVHLTISGNGTVKDTSATGNDPAIAKCIENSVRMWTFPASGGNTDVDIPFHFLRQ